MADPVPDSLTHEREARHLVFTIVALLGLAAASWALAHVELGGFAAAVAIGVACMKALLVALVFMRLLHGDTASRFAIGIAVGFIVLLMLGVVGDVLLR